MEINGNNFSPCICLTYDCNLNCIYCYQSHTTGKKMSFDIAKKTIDWIFSNMPADRDGITISFIGGEPLLEFPLIKDIFDYTADRKVTYPFLFFASTNGTLLTDKMKAWFTEHKERFWLGLSLDGRKETQDHNRSHSFDSIDIDFFRETWPEQNIKMTLSEFSLNHFAEDIKYLHSIGFKKINGVNLFEGDFNWDKDEYLSILSSQLSELVEFYVENDTLELNQMLDKSLDFCEAKNIGERKWCGIGTEPFFDIDGKRYPCAYITPMTFSQQELDAISKIDFTYDRNFIDDECYHGCYIYPICSTCAGANYMVNKSFKIRNKSKCRIHKLIALFIADLQAKRISKNKNIMDEEVLFHTIEAIKKIRSLYFDEFSQYFKNE